VEKTPELERLPPRLSQRKQAQTGALSEVFPMSKYTKRLTANAEDFDKIVTDMLDEIRHLKNQKRRLRHEISNVELELLQAILRYGERNWMPEMTAQVVQLIKTEFDQIRAGYTPKLGE
jgi:hypothetical protein